VDEQHLDSLRCWQPFERQGDPAIARLVALSQALWGRTGEDLRRQLLAPAPAIPPGCTLLELEWLRRNAVQMLHHYLAFARTLPTTPNQLRPDEVIVVGTERFNTLEARLEVARRAIHKLRNRK
jgi:hypothetical protein